MNVPLMLNVMIMIMASPIATLHQIPMYAFNVLKILIVHQRSVTLPTMFVMLVSTLTQVIR